MLKTFEQNTPECKSGNCFHLFYHCKEKKCTLNEPVFTSSLKGVAWPLCLELTRYSKQQKWVYLPFLSKCKQFCVINKHKPTNKKLSYLNEDKLVKESLKLVFRKKTTRKLVFRIQKYSRKSTHSNTVVQLKWLPYCLWWIYRHLVACLCQKWRDVQCSLLFPQYNKSCQWRLYLPL